MTELPADRRRIFCNDAIHRLPTVNTTVIPKTDKDALVPATPEQGEKAKAAMTALPDQAAKDIDPAWVADAFVVDTKLNACGETYETLQ